MTDYAAARGAITAALRKANQLIGVGDILGWERPKAYTDALAMLNAARQAQHALPAPIPPATKPKEIAKWIDDTAELRARQAARDDAVQELILTWERQLADAGLSVLADYTNRL